MTLRESVMELANRWKRMAGTLKAGERKTTLAQCADNLESAVKSTNVDNWEAEVVQMIGQTIDNPAIPPMNYNDVYRDLKGLEAAYLRSGLDVSPCMQCGEAVICLPDGMPMCEDCGQSEADAQQSGGAADVDAEAQTESEESASQPESDDADDEAKDRAVEAIVNNPEVLDELKDRIENDEIVDETPETASDDT